MLGLEYGSAAYKACAQPAAIFLTHNTIVQKVWGGGVQTRGAGEINRVGRTLALHVINLGLIPSTLHGSLSTAKNDL